MDIIDESTIRLKIDNQSIEIRLGEWSPVFELKFKIGFGVTVKAVTQVVINQIEPGPQLYFVPLQLHPLKSPWPYATPKRFIKDVWKNSGPYLTLGWHQDTTALEDGLITDKQFLDLCMFIRGQRERTLLKMIQLL